METAEPAAVVVVLRRGDEELGSWPVQRLGRSNLAVLDELLKMQLAALRHGCSVALRDPCPKLVALIDLAGLASVLSVQV